MNKPIVVIAGRPNVGKSTLFNAIAGSRISIVEDVPGVTRDRIYADVEWTGHSFALIDTGGIEPGSKDDIFTQMRKQALCAIESADVILFMTDLKTGPVGEDERIASILRRSGKKVLLVVNKVDSFVRDGGAVYEFLSLGMGEPYPVSASNRMGIGDLLDEVVKMLPIREREEDTGNRAKVAIVGRPNVGKSSIINGLLGQERLIVSDNAGTTRDAVDTVLKHGGKEYIFIDTAGIRRKNKIREDLEHYMIMRAIAAIERSDVAVVVIDATEGVTEQDAKIAGIAHERGKGIILAVNKWDAVEKDTGTAREFTLKLRSALSFLSYAEVLFISAKTRQRLVKLYQLIDEVVRNANRRVGTGVLNEVLSEAVALQQPPTDKGRRLRCYYITQVLAPPPTFVLFVNDKKLMHFSYERYLENMVRTAFDFRGTSIRILVRERRRKEAGEL